MLSGLLSVVMVAVLAGTVVGVAILVLAVPVPFVVAMVRDAVRKRFDAKG